MLSIPNLQIRVCNVGLLISLVNTSAIVNWLTYMRYVLGCCQVFL